MTTGYLIQSCLSLAILAGIMWAVLHVTKRLKDQKFKGELTITDRLPLNTSTAIVVVKFRNTEYLMSVGGQNVQLLEKYE